MTRQALLIFFCSVLLWALAVLLDIRTFYVLSAFGLGSEIVSFLLLLNAGRRLSVTRRLPRSVRQGDTVTVELALSAGRGTSHGAMLIHDINPAAGRRDTPIIWLSGLRGAQEILLTYEAEAVLRGDHTFDTVEITCTDPLGFFRRQRRLSCPGHMLVLPRWERVSLLPFNSRQRSYLVGIERTTVEGEGQEFFGIREYRHGDSMRRVHWGSTARTGRPMVRQFENESRPNIALFVDTAPSGADRDKARRRLDRCAAVASSLAMHVLDSGSRVSCAAAGQSESSLMLQGGDLHRHRLLRFLADLELSEAVPTQRALTEAIGRLGGGDALVVILATLDARCAAALSAFCHSGGSAVVFLVGPGDEARGKRRRWRRVVAPEDIVDVERYVQGLNALGIPVVRAEEEGSLDRSIQAWLR